MIEIPTDTAVLDQIASVASEAGEQLTRNQVSAVLAAYINILAGDPVGTVRRDPETGSMAIRVNDNGLHVWRVNNPATGEQYNDTQPSIDWPEV
jgi:hypothetical protein